MSVAQNSVLARLLTTLWAVLYRVWEGSVPGRVFARIGRAVRHGVAGSAVCQFVWREGVFPRSWPESWVCRVCTVILNLPVLFLQWLYRKGKKVWDASVAFRFASAVGGASFVFVGLSMLLLLIVPHASWDNGYALRCMLLVFLLFLAGSMARPRHRLELDRLGPYLTLFMAFIVYGFFGSLGTTFENGVLHGLTSESQNPSLRFLVFYVIAFLIALLAVSTVQKVEQLQLVLVIAAAGLVVASLYGCYQGYVGVDVVPSQQDMLLNPNMPGRVYSYFDNPNNFAEILVMLMPFLAALLLNARTWLGRVLALASIVPCVVAIGLTLSRSCWIGLVIALGVFLVLINWRFLPLLLVLGVAAIPFLPESILNRILTIGNLKDTSTAYRFAIYQDTTYLIRDYGLRGVGLGTDVMKQVFQVYPTMFDGNYPIHTHNNYLQMWGELGVFGAITYLAMVLHQLKTGVKTFYSCTERRVKTILAAGVGAFFGISVVGVAEYTWFYPRNMFVYFFLFGVIAACIKLAKPRREKNI